MCADYGRSVISSYHMSLMRPTAELTDPDEICGLVPPINSLESTWIRIVRDQDITVLSPFFVLHRAKQLRYKNHMLQSAK